MIGLFITRFGNQYGNVELDATIDESHEWKAEATSNPVEEGAPVTDHVIEQADKLSIKGFVTDTPIGSQSLQLQRSQDVFDLLYSLIKKREPMTIYTKHKIYFDMILTGINIPRLHTVGEAIEFSAEFINIRKVATEIVDVPKGISAKKDAKSDAATGRKTEPQKDGGKKQAVEKSSSTLSRIFK